MNSRVAHERRDLQVGKRPAQTIQERGALSDVFEVPAVGSSVHNSGMPLPFQTTEIIMVVIVVWPKSQVVRSIARTHGLPESLSRSTTTRAVEPHEPAEPIKPPPHRVGLRRARDKRRQPPQAERSGLHDQERKPRQPRVPCGRQVDVFCCRLG